MCVTVLAVLTPYRSLTRPWHQRLDTHQVYCAPTYDVELLQYFYTLPRPNSLWFSAVHPEGIRLHEREHCSKAYHAHTQHRLPSSYVHALSALTSVVLHTQMLRILVLCRAKQERTSHLCQRLNGHNHVEVRRFQTVSVAEGNRSKTIPRGSFREIL